MLAGPQQNWSLALGSICTVGLDSATWALEARTTRRTYYITMGPVVWTGQQQDIASKQLPLPSTHNKLLHAHCSDRRYSSWNRFQLVRDENKDINNSCTYSLTADPCMHSLAYMHLCD